MAIARGTSTTLGNLGGGPQTFLGPTISGANTYGVFFGFSRGSDISGVTWNGVAMVKVGSIQGPVADTGDFDSIWIIANPTTGNLTVSGGSSIVAGVAMYYTGVNQTGQPDASTTNSTIATATMTTSVTVVAANSWTLLVGRSSSGVPAAGTGSNLIASSLIAAFDSNTPLAAGSQSMTTSGTAGDNMFGVMCSLSPVSVIVASKIPSTLLMMGVGT